MVTDHPRDPRSPSYGGRAANTTPARGISPPDISDCWQCYWVFGLPPPDVLSARLVVMSSCALPGAWMATLIVALPAFLSFPQVGRQVIRDPGFFCRGYGTRTPVVRSVEQWKSSSWKHKWSFACPENAASRSRTDFFKEGAAYPKQLISAFISARVSPGYKKPDP